MKTYAMDFIWVLESYLYIGTSTIFLNYSDYYYYYLIIL